MSDQEEQAVSDIKRMDIGEFRRIGYLQEANRRFFHPHGLALEMTSVDAGGDASLQSKIAAALRDAISGHAVGISGALPDGDVAVLAWAITQALAPPGSCRLSGVWDYRDDAEGIYFGDWQPDAVQKVEDVAAERRRHYLARARMFGTHVGDGLETEVERIGSEAVLDSDLARGGDIEPTTFVEPRDSRPTVDPA